MSSTAATRPQRGETRLGAAIAVCIRALWFVVIPALLAGLTYRYLVPAPNAGFDGLLGKLAHWATLAPAPLAAGLFLLFALLLRYWSARLPGAAQWVLPASEPGPFNLKQGLLWGGALLAAVAAAVVLRSSVYQSYRVLSASMLPTLEPGAHLVATRFAYGLRPFRPMSRLPERGDVVVFASSLGLDVPDQLVKRVIGLPGDVIGMKGGRPSINGWEVPSCSAGRYVYLSPNGMLDSTLTLEFLENRVYLTAQSPTNQTIIEGYTVRPGEVFVLGDNRNNSSDSRAWNGGRGGGLALSAILGRVDRLLVGVKRNGEADFSQLFQKLGLDVHAEGFDLAPLRQGIERCLKERPKNTFPPAAQSVGPSSP